MRRLLLLVLGVFVLAGVITVCFAADNTTAVATCQPERISGTVIETISGSAVVQDIDYTTRVVTLGYNNGNTETITAGPEIRNFDQIKKGDKVNVNYSAEVTLLVGGPAQPLSRKEVVEVGRAPLGEKPAAEIEAVTDISAVIEDIDYVNRVVTVKGPQRTLKIKLDPQAKNLEKIKKGDAVSLQIAEELAINVTP